MTIRFKKMHGLGNDFIIIDQRAGGETFTTAQIIALSDRRLGIGCDQFIHIKLPKTAGADAFLEMYNSDGSQLEACGNGTRCVAHILMLESGSHDCTLETVSGLLRCNRVRDTLICADMGEPRLGWDQIPLAERCDTLHLGIGDGGRLSDPVAVSMGNPHCIFFVDHVEKLPIEILGPAVERNTLFPNRTNVEFAQILALDKIRMRVWERGAGITMACGSGACATMVASARRGLTGRKAEIVLDGGSLFLEWRESDNHVLMTGPVTDVFDGTLKGL